MILFLQSLPIVAKINSKRQEKMLKYLECDKSEIKCVPVSNDYAESSIGRFKDSYIRMRSGKYTVAI